MKKVIGFVILCAGFALSACSRSTPFETMGSVSQQSNADLKQQIVVALPNGASICEENEQEKVYMCDGYTLSVQTMMGGDLNRTLKAITGFPKEELKIIETFENGTKKYSCVWTSAGEQELQVGRSCILDDGFYHYAVTVMAGESKTGKLQSTWENLLGSCRLMDASVDLSTGS